MSARLSFARSSRGPLRGEPVRGSCLCGRVAFELAEKPRRMIHCHCSRCRRAHSAAHATSLFIELRHFQWTCGEREINRYGPAEDWHLSTAFCRSCGSTVPRVVKGIGLAVVPAGALDTDPGIRPAVHAFARAKAAWFDITDDLPQYAGAPPVG